jgi:hypothetical protein
MAITTAMCNSFKSELLQGLHDFTSDVIKIALIKASPSGTYGAATTNYSDVTGNSDEASGTGYTPDAETLTTVSVTLDASGTAYVDFGDDAEWTSATISADGCLIYNETASDKAIAVIDFGGTKTSTNGTFTVQFPTPGPTTAIIRIA